MIGTITFHWAVNYGAVLQAYALQRSLAEKGYDAEIIDYVPSRVRIREMLSHLKKGDKEYFVKKKKMAPFVKNELKLSAKKYGTNAKLMKCSDMYDAVICGSDQVWNEFFTQHAEGKPTLSYFLNFVGKNTKKIGYAVSFGTEKLTDAMKKLIAPEVKTFKAISVREKTGTDILSDLGVQSEQVCDPTLLFDGKYYEDLVKKAKNVEKQRVFSYIIHANQSEAVKISDTVKDHFGESHTGKYYYPMCGIYEWLAGIYNSEFVVTNSFHGTVFAILFHKPFIITTIKGSGMNDRIYTLLSSAGLMDRMVSECDEKAIEKLISEKTDWDEVDKKLGLIRNKSAQFLEEALNS